MSAQEIIDARKGKPTLGTKIDEMDNELAAHKAENMPHQIKDLDNNKTYRYGLQIKDGVTQFIYEEVI